MGKLTGNYFLWQTVVQWHAGMALVIVKFKHIEGVVSAFSHRIIPAKIWVMPRLRNFDVDCTGISFKMLMDFISFMLSSLVWFGRDLGILLRVMWVNDNGCARHLSYSMGQEIAGASVKTLNEPSWNLGSPSKPPRACKWDDNTCLLVLRWGWN